MKRRHTGTCPFFEFVPCNAKPPIIHATLKRMPQVLSAAKQASVVARTNDCLPLSRYAGVALEKVQALVAFPPTRALNLLLVDPREP